MKKIIYLLVVSFSPMLSFAEIPKPMLENVEALSTMKVPVDLCRAAKDFEGMAVQKKIRVMSMGVKIDGSVLKIQKYYKDKYLFEAYLNSVSAYISSEQKKKTILNKYGNYCSDKLINEIDNMHADADSQLDKFFR
jgi:hypothetical protein